MNASGTSERSSGEITRLLREASSGNRAAFDRLVPLVYDELHRIADNRLRSEASGHTLTPTALVHEAYLQLVAQDRTEWHSRSHFFAIAAQVMRRILINYAKMKQALKRGEGVTHVDLAAAEHLGALAITDRQSDELLALDDALTQLRAFNPEGADVVEYHFFGGLGFREIAEVMGVSEVTTRRRWTAARAWLRGALRDDVRDWSGVALTATADRSP